MKIFLTTSAGSESQLGHALINLNRLTAFGRCPLLSNNGQNVAVPRLSASLIGRSGSSAFRLPTTAVSMSLAGSCFSSESALGPFQYGIRERGGTI